MKNTNHRNPSRHRIEEHDMLNWCKATRKRMNAGRQKPERVVLFEKLLALAEENKHVNQWKLKSSFEEIRCLHPKNY